MKTDFPPFLTNVIIATDNYWNSARYSFTQNEAENYLDAFKDYDTALKIGSLLSHKGEWSSQAVPENEVLPLPSLPNQVLKVVEDSREIMPSHFRLKMLGERLGLNSSSDKGLIEKYRQTKLFEKTEGNLDFHSKAIHIVEEDFPSFAIASEVIKWKRFTSIVTRAVYYARANEKNILVSNMGTILRSPDALRPYPIPRFPINTIYSITRDENRLQKIVSATLLEAVDKKI